MGKTRDTGYLRNLLTYDASGNITTTGTISASGGTVSYLPLSGGTLTGGLSGTTGVFSSSVSAATLASSGDITGTGNLTLNTGANRHVQIGSVTNYYWRLRAFNDDLEINGGANAFTALKFYYPNGAATFSNTVTASSFIKSGGTSAQFLKADGSSDSSTFSQIYSGGITLQGGVAYNGWVRLAITNLNAGGYGPRGAFKITVANTGNYLDPAQDVIYGYKDWGNTVFINHIDSYLTTTFTQYRITTDTNYAYLEGYVNWTPGGDQSIATYSEPNGHNGLQWNLASGYAVSGLASPSSSDTITRVANGSTFRNLYTTNNVGIGTSSPRTRLQVTPVSNAETPVLGTATGVATFTSANTNYGLQFNSTSDGTFFIQSQRFDNNSTAYPLGLNPVGGYVYLGKGWGASNHRINLQVAQGNNILVVSAYSGASNDSVIIKAASGANPNATTTVMEVTTNSATGRSISAGGTINASGNDYAEYMVKATTDSISKGDIVGVNAEGHLTNVFAEAVSFVVKSTDPSYVGGDAWGNVVGKRPERTTDQTVEEFAPILASFEAKLEAERAKVDRIAFSGQVPCNVYNAQVGDYIVPIELADGKIGGEAIANPTFEQYQKAVGKVWKVLPDGRAWIAVKIG